MKTILKFVKRKINIFKKIASINDEEKTKKKKKSKFKKFNCNYQQHQKVFISIIQLPIPKNFIRKYNILCSQAITSNQKISFYLKIFPYKKRGS